MSGIKRHRRTLGHADDEDDEDEGEDDDGGDEGARLCMYAARVPHTHTPRAALRLSRSPRASVRAAELWLVRAPRVQWPGRGRRGHGGEPRSEQRQQPHG